MTAPLPEEDLPQNRFFRAWALWILKLRWPILVAMLAGTGFFVYQIATRLVIDNTMEAYLSDESEDKARLMEARADFGNDVYFQVVVEGDVFSLPYLQKLKALHEELAQLDVPLLEDRKTPRPAKQGGSKATAKAELPSELAGFGDSGWGDEGGGTLVESIVSLINAPQTHWENDALSVRGLLEEWPRVEDLPALKRRALDDRLLRGQIVGPAARHSVVVVQTAQMSERNNARVADEIRRVVARHDAPGFQVFVAGMPALTTGLNDLVISDMARTCALAFLAVLVVLIFIFRHPMGVIGPILVVALAALWTAGLMAATDVPMTMVTNIMPVLLVCVGIGESVHMQSVFHDARGRGMNNHDAVVYTLATSAVPCIFTTLTTAFGLLSFRVAQLQGLQHMGIFGCFGVVMAGVGALVLLPLVLSFSPESFSKRWDVDTSTESSLARFVDRLVLFCAGLSRPERRADGRLSFRRRNFVLAFHGALLAVAAVSMGSLKFYHNPADWVPASADVTRAFHALNDNVGGASNVVLLVDSGKAGGLKDPELLARMSRLEEHIRTYRHGPGHEPVVDGTTSVVELLRRGSRAMHGGDPAFDRVPTDAQAVTDLFGFYENAAPDQLRRFVTVDAQRGMILVQVRWLDALAYEPLTAHIQAGIDQHIGSAAVVRPTGTVFNMCSVVHFLLRDQITSFGSGMAAVAVLMVLVLRELKLGLLGMIPNVLPILLLLGFMGMAGIPIDAITLLVASISIGIAVDDTIRWWHRFRIEYRHGGDVEQAISTSLRHTGRGTVFTSVIVACGFGVFLSASLSNARLFGALCSFGVLLALFADLVLGPAVLRAAYKNLTLSSGAESIASHPSGPPRAAPEGS